MFLQRPKPQKDETLESFLIRVANKNGYEDVHRFLMATKRYLQDIDHTLFQTFPTDIKLINPYSSKVNSRSRTEALHRFSQMTFNEPTELLELSINRSQIKYSSSVSALIRGAEVIPRSLLRSAVPCCDQCLQEDGVASYRWHFVGYNYCHKHESKLIEQCQCGASYDYRTNGLNGICQVCKVPLKSNPDVSCENAYLISCWLAGESINVFPDLPKSYRWGLIHWWEQVSGINFCADSFTDFWNNWPNSLQQMIEAEINFNLEHAIVDFKQLRVKDLIGNLFFKSILLPQRNLEYNVILCELLKHIDQRLWDNQGLLANLKMNAFEVTVFLNCSLDQVASMVEQRYLKPTIRQKPNVPVKNSDHVFYLGDVYCLWLAEFQTDEFNRSFYVSKW
ncbi:MAG: TniQ family protein [Aliivibrio sp.]|uniref:TniQ family protein n=1 Tax=Aliivibrio sp. TaxID=1872443 RepID=UPI001A540B8C|nr:TniQ family protein [Aliivibrio sp.]